MQSLIATETTRSSTDAVPVPRVEALPSPREEAWRQRLTNLVLILSDVALAIIVWEIACLVQILLSPGSLPGIAVASIVPMTLVWVGLRATQGLYPGYGMDEAEELKRQTYALVATLAVAVIFAVAFQIGDASSRFLLILVFAGLLFLSPLMRLIVKNRMADHGVWGKPVLVLGPGKEGAEVASTLRQEWKLGFRPVGLFDDRLSPKERLIDTNPLIELASRRNPLAEAENTARRHGIDTIVLAMSRVRRDDLAEVVDELSNSFRNVIVIPDIGGVTNSAAIARDFGGTFGVEVRQNLLDPWVRRFKRALDLIGVLVGGMLISPLLVALAVLIKLDSPGPAFFSHRRLGARNAYFRCWKFRTMRAETESFLEEYLKNNPHLRTEWEQNHKLKDDPRVTRVGRFLRKTSLDELPQLWNVLKGEMSLVGPRPIVDAEVCKYGKFYGLYKRIKPGMSGFWQVSGRSDTSYDERVAMDAYYVRNWSVWLDLVILTRTVRSVLYGRGAR